MEEAQPRTRRIRHAQNIVSLPALFSCSVGEKAKVASFFSFQAGIVFMTVAEIGIECFLSVTIPRFQCHMFQLPEFMTFDVRFFSRSEVIWRTVIGSASASI